MERTRVEDEEKEGVGREVGQMSEVEIGLVHAVQR